MKDIACLIIAFQRKANVLSLLDEIKKNDISKIYVSIDGPRNPAERINQNEMIVAINMWSKVNNTRVNLWKREFNQGAAVSVIASLDWVSNLEANFIILEDDLVPNKSFFDFAYKFINEESHNNKILLASGNNFFFDRFEEDNSILVTLPLIWGWITTSEKWKVMRKGILQDRLHFFNARNFKLASFLRAGKIRALNGIVDAWDIPLAHFMFIHKYYCVLPPRNLVSNFGHDIHATHTNVNTWPLGMRTFELDNRILDFRKLEYSPEMDKLIAKLLYRVKLRHIVSGYSVKLIDLILGRKPKYKTSLIARLETLESTSEFLKLKNR